MALRRAARVRLAAARRNTGAVVWPGQRARNFQHTARDSLRCENRRALCAVDASRRKAGTHLYLQQSALRSSCARIRLRLFARLSKHALSVGSTIRRFFERRANDHRPVYRFCGVEMAAAERDRAALAARVRRARSRTFKRPARALSPTLRRGQYSSLQSHYRRAVLSCPAATDETRLH